MNDEHVRLLWLNLLGREWVIVLFGPNRFKGRAIFLALDASVRAGTSFIEAQGDIWVLRTQINAETFSQIGLAPATPDGSLAKRRRAFDGFYFFVASGDPPSGRQKLKSATSL
jgi:hypothetical protein